MGGLSERSRARDVQVMLRFDSLKNVLRAVTYNRVQLGLTVALGLILMFLYRCVRPVPRAAAAAHHGFSIARVVWRPHAHACAASSRSTSCAPCTSSGTTGSRGATRCSSASSPRCARVWGGIISQICMRLSRFQFMLVPPQVNGGWRSGGGIGDQLAYVSSHEHPGAWRRAALCCFLLRLRGSTFVLEHRPLLWDGRVLLVVLGVPLRHFPERHFRCDCGHVCGSPRQEQGACAARGAVCEPKRRGLLRHAPGVQFV